jgi:hypothetical protein
MSRLIKLCFYSLLGLTLLIIGYDQYSIYNRDHYVFPKVVQLLSERGSCSGIHVEVNKKTYILSASHCLPLKNEQNEILVKDDLMTGPIPRKVLYEDTSSDIIMLESLPNRNGVKLAKNIDLREDIYSYTHGAGLATHKTIGYYIQNMIIEVPLFPIFSEEDEKKCDIKKPKYKIMDMFILKACILKTDSMVTEMPSAPGSSGGAVVNKYGELIGLVFAGSSRYTFLVTLTDLQRVLSNWK